MPGDPETLEDKEVLARTEDHNPNSSAGNDLLASTDHNPIGNSDHIPNRNRAPIPKTTVVASISVGKQKGKGKRGPGHPQKIRRTTEVQCLLLGRQSGQWRPALRCGIMISCTMPNVY